MPLMSRGSEDGFVWLHAFVARYGLVMRLEALVTHSFESMLFLLERIQHRFTRMIPGFKTLSYEEKLRKLDLWTQRLWSHPTCWRYINKSIIIIIIIEERRNRADLLQVFKMYKGLSTIPFSNFFTLSTTVVNTRTHCQDCEKPMSVGYKTVLLFFKSDWSLEWVRAKCHRLR